MKTMDFSYTSEPILTINNKVLKRQIDLNPKFQRGYIWKNEFKDELIVSILNNYPIGNIVFFNNKNNRNILEVVDGQQRLKTIINFLSESNPYLIKNKKSIEKIRNISNQYFAEYSSIFTKDDEDKFNDLMKKTSISFSDLPTLIKDDFVSYNLNITTITDQNSKNISEYFKFVQNQETLKAGEIINSIYLYNFDLNQLISRISDKKDFLKFLNIVEKRHEFDKNFINIIGVLLNKIKLNSPSGQIVDFASEFNYKGDNEYIELLISNINKICAGLQEQDDYTSIIRNGNIRILKLSLVYLSFNELQDIKSLADVIEYIEMQIKKKDTYIIENISYIESRARGFHEIQDVAILMQKLINEGKINGSN